MYKLLSVANAVVWLAVGFAANEVWRRSTITIKGETVKEGQS